MPLTTTWDITYEGVPADTDAANTLGDVIRDLKRDVRERMEVDHDWDDVTNAGQHKRVSLQEQTVDPSTTSNLGYVYTKDVSGSTELFYKSDSGLVIQLTSGGFVGGATAILLNNNVALQGKEAGGVARDLAKMNATDQVELGTSARDVIINILTAATGLGLKVAGGALKKIWHEENDGPGSTLDADTVDGIQGANILNFAAGSYFEYGPVAVAQSVSAAHGLGARPRLWLGVLRCVSVDGGYAVDDEIIVAAAYHFAAHGYMPWANATHIGMSQTNAGDDSLRTKDGTAGFSPDYTKWRVVLRAWK